MPSTVSSHESSGVVDPSPAECQRHRQSRTRPLIVSTVKSCRPLFCLVFPVLGSFGGGKSGFRRIESHLQALLEGLLSQVREPVADLLLAAGDDIPWRCLVDRVGDSSQRLLYLGSHLGDELVT